MVDQDNEFQKTHEFVLREQSGTRRRSSLGHGTGDGKGFPEAGEESYANVRANTPLTDLIRSGFAAFTTIDGMPTVPASLRIGLGAKWKNSEGARQVHAT